MNEKKMSIKEYKDEVEAFITNAYRGVSEDCSKCQSKYKHFSYVAYDKYFEEDYAKDEENAKEFIDYCYACADAFYDAYKKLDKLSDTAIKLAERVWTTRLKDNDQLIYRFAMLNIIDQCHKIRDQLIKWYKEVAEVAFNEFCLEIPFGDKEGVWDL